MLLKVLGGRVYCFYNYNRDNIREVIADDPPFAGGRQQSCDGKAIVGLLWVWSELSPGRKSWVAARKHHALRPAAARRSITLPARCSAIPA